MTLPVSHRALGIDFGTTNSALAVADRSGEARLAHFATAHGTTDTFRSILYFEPGPIRGGHGGDSIVAGPEAIRRYREAIHKGRFIQSLKTYLGDSSFTGTLIGGRRRSLEELIGLILQRLLAAGTAALGPLPARAVVGRPVHFTTARSEEDDDLALGRLRTALGYAGITEPVFEYEPVAAAYAYRQRLQKPATVLIGDFGGGTSDFSILALEPAIAAGSNGIAILGNDGVAIAGDAFDRLIVQHAVAPQLGKGSEYLSPPHKMLPTPEWVYSRLERWHHLSFLKSTTTIEMLERVQKTSTARNAIAALLHLIDEDLGYELHEAVNGAKTALSATLETDLHFALSPVSIDWHGTRDEFEQWLAPDLAVIDSCVEGLLTRAGVAAAAIDTVFLTGGSSFVPSVRRLFEERFPNAAITGGQELTSVATGLALRAHSGNA
ncbi:MAG: Hsp70 family protein [Vicinamibacterales bacterium]